MIVEGLSVRAEVNLLKHNHKWFKCDRSFFLSISGLWGLHCVSLAVTVHCGVHHTRCTAVLKAVGTRRPAPSIELAMVLALKSHWPKFDHMVILSCKEG